jgi:hypothetical protein
MRQREQVMERPLMGLNAPGVTALAILANACFIVGTVSSIHAQSVF